jgi:hypothetical protein
MLGAFGWGAFGWAMVGWFRFALPFLPDAHGDGFDAFLFLSFVFGVLL